MFEILGKEKPYQASEDYLQKAVVRLIWGQYPKVLFIHPPNGGFRNGREASKFKLMGVRAGVSDLIFLEPRNNYTGLIIELKTKKTKITESQIKFLNQAYDRGFLCVVCYNFESVQETLKEYFKGEQRKLFYK